MKMPETPKGVPTREEELEFFAKAAEYEKWRKRQDRLLTLALLLFAGLWAFILFVH